MALKEKKRSFLARIRNYFIAGVVVLIPIGITVYLTIFLISISSNKMNKYLGIESVTLQLLISIFLVHFHLHDFLMPQTH